MRSQARNDCQSRMNPTPSNDDPPFPKAEARSRARKIWRKIREEAPEALDRITSHWRNFLETPQNRGARILIYVPLPDEIDLLPTLVSRNPATIFAPCTFPDHRMEFRQFAPGSERAIPGYQNVPGPAPDAPLLELPLTPADLVVIPALGANRNGVRLGRGGGYYDRWRDRLERAQTIGVLPNALANLTFSGESHDIRFNYIITEDGLFQR